MQCPSSRPDPFSAFSASNFLSLQLPLLVWYPPPSPTNAHQSPAYLTPLFSAPFLLHFFLLVSSPSEFLLIFTSLRPRLFLLPGLLILFVYKAFADSFGQGC